MKKLILHTGFHKTATSSIQHYLSNNKSQLSENNYLYPLFKVKGNVIENHSIPLYSLFCDSPESYHINIRWGLDVTEINNYYKGVLNSALSSDKDIVISGEDISILDRTGLLNLKTTIESYGYEIRVVSYIRTPYSFACSLIQQNIKGGIESLSNITLPTASQFIKNIKEVFPLSEFYTFDEALQYPGGPVSHFMGLLGIKAYQSKVSNLGLGNASTRLINHINLYCPSIVDGVLNIEREGYHHFHEDFNFDEKKFLLTAEELSLIENDLSKENAIYASLLGEKFCDTSHPISSAVYFTQDMVDFIAGFKHRLPVAFMPYIYDFIKLSRHDLDLSLANLFQSSLLPFEFHVYRDTAMLWEKKDTAIALKFMLLAQHMKPNGELINRKISEYQKILNARSDNNV